MFPDEGKKPKSSGICELICLCNLEEIIQFTPTSVILDLDLCWCHSLRKQLQQAARGSVPFGNIHNIAFLVVP